MKSLPPNTPVLAGSAQVTRRPAPDTGAASGLEPVDLMAEALAGAAEDCGGSGAGRSLLERASTLCAIGTLCWEYRNPALLVAERLGLDPPHLCSTPVGGNSGQLVAAYAARAISEGQIDVALVTGAESFYSARAARRDPSHPSLDWTSQPPETPDPLYVGTDKDPVTVTELQAGLDRPARVFALFENAIRHVRGWTIDEHRRKLGSLWASLSRVAAGNPNAWIRREYGPEEICQVSESNRMVSFPYTKLLNANDQIDEAAAFILCSAEAAAAAGVPADRFVFPVSSADANDHWFMSHRMNLYSSPAIALAGRAALDLAGASIDDIGLVDLYSCFPSAVQMAADALGLPIDDPSRPLTVTGGLTFAGGPGNNYVTHSIGAMAGRLRESSGGTGLVTGLGWYASKHSVGIWSAEPPAEGFHYVNVQDEVDRLPQRRPATDDTDGVEIETYTVVHSKAGPANFAIASYLTEDGCRGWGQIHDKATLASLEVEEGCGRKATVEPASPAIDDGQSRARRARTAGQGSPAIPGITAALNAALDPDRAPAPRELNIH